jgi:hypothetical protein
MDAGASAEIHVYLVTVNTGFYGKQGANRDGPLPGLHLTSIMPSVSLIKKWYCGLGKTRRIIYR